MTNSTEMNEWACVQAKDRQACKLYKNLKFDWMLIWLTTLWTHLGCSDLSNTVLVEKNQCRITLTSLYIILSVLGIFNASDLCKYVNSVDQADSDSDGVGNICDNCPSNSNADQVSKILGMVCFLYQL